ncbi:O-antigen ligase family protein [Propionibacteriaceae bacterium G1746]|uniref:O-antigen ligase family protein n=1 Tax=Aestuariimicrobium sp. G57 TaxID=3418485 RepID=UPI003C151442
MIPAAKSKHRSTLQLTVVLLALTGIFLNQSGVIGGVNLSLADPLMLLLLLSAATAKQLRVPTTPLLFFLLVSSTTLLTTILLTPMWAPSGVPASSVLASFVKLLTCFGYFILGAHLARTGNGQRILRYFALGATLVSAVGVVSLITPLPGTGSMYYAGVRFRGLMNDPNYFAILAICGLAAIAHDEEIKTRTRLVAYPVLAGAILLSGSKTGLVVLILFAMSRALFRWRTPRQGRRTQLSALGLMATLVVALCLLIVAWNGPWAQSLAQTFETIPALNRLVPLLTDFGSALEQSGSDRDASWQGALTLIATSPLVGVGLGSYSHVLAALTGTEAIAHNTYLQLAAEWGLVLTAIFFAWVIYLMTRKPRSSAAGIIALAATSKSVLLVLFAGSLAISLNNARLFWLVLGMLAALQVRDLTAEHQAAVPAPDPQPAVEKLPATAASS